MKKNATLLVILCGIVLILSGSASAAEIQSHYKINLTVANDNGVRFNSNNDNTYSYFYGSGDGTNSIKITNDSSSTNPKVIFTNSQSGTFYITNTGGKGYSDDGILMLAVNGTIPENFKLHIKASGYQWTPTTGTAPNFAIITYNSSTLDEFYNQTDFAYGPQTWKPYYSNYPIYEGQDISNLTNRFSIMFIDLNAGILNPSKYSGQTLTDKGMIKIQYSIENLPYLSLATFNAFAYSHAPATNQPPGVEWTNAVNALGQTSTVTSGYYVNGIDTLAPSIISLPKGGLFNTAQTVTITTTDTNSPSTTYYTIDGSDPKTSNTRTEYTTPIQIKNTTTIRYSAIDPSGNWSPNYIQTYIIDKLAPTVNVNIKGGLYNSYKTITLKMNESGRIYYTSDGSKPTTKSKLYTKPFTLTKTTVLKYMAIDLAGNQSPTHTQTYRIDKTKPFVIKSNPKNNAINVLLTSNVTITFSEKIIPAANLKKIYIKNLSTGKIVHITKSLKNKTLTIKQIRSRLHKNQYLVYIPKGAFKDQAGNMSREYIYKFKTK